MLLFEKQIASPLPSLLRQSLYKHIWVINIANKNCIAGIILTFYTDFFVLLQLGYKMW